MIDKDEEQSQEHKSAEVLKEVFQGIADNNAVEDPQVSSEEMKEQIKGSDADVDHNSQTSTEDAADQVKGSDADRDK